LYKSGSHHNIMSEDPVPLKIRRSLWNRIHPIITSYLLYVLRRSRRTIIYFVP
jgi:hypothetical protein